MRDVGRLAPAVKAGGTLQAPDDELTLIAKAAELEEGKKNKTVCFVRGF